MKTSHHEVVRTICCILGAAAIGWIAFDLHGYTSVAKQLKPHVVSIAENSDKLMENLAATADNLASITGSLRDPQNGVPPLMAFLNGKQGVKEVVRNIDLLTAQGARTSTTLELASRDEQAQIRQAVSVVIADMDSIGKLVTDTNNSLNGSLGVMPAIVDDLHALDSTISGLQADSHNLLQAGTADMRDVGIVITNPDIPAALKSVAEAANHGNEALAHVSKATEYIEMDLAPSKRPLWETIGIMALSQALGIPIHWLPQKVSIVK